MDDDVTMDGIIDQRSTKSTRAAKTKAEKEEDYFITHLLLSSYMNVMDIIIWLCKFQHSALIIV